MWRKLAGVVCTSVGCLTLVSPVSAHERDRVVRTVRAGGEHVRLTTHGDPRAAFAAPGAGPAQGGGAAASLAPQLCGLSGSVDDTAHATDLRRPLYKVVYAHPSDQPSRLAQYGGTFAELVGAASDTFGRGSGGELQLRVDRGTSRGKTSWTSRRCVCRERSASTRAWARTAYTVRLRRTSGPC